MADITNVEALGSETIYNIKNNLGDFQIKSYDKNVIHKDQIIIEVKNDNIKYFDDKQNLITDVIGRSKDEIITNQFIKKGQKRHLILQIKL